MSKPWVILSNIGTPDSPSVDDVKKYLDQFLMDPDVVSLPYLARLFLVRGLVVPRRAPKSAAKYASIWTSDGSPLLVFSKKLLAKVKHQLPNCEVRLGMRYGSPSIESAMAEAAAGGAKEVMLVPLFPQFAQATTGSIRCYAEKLAKSYAIHKFRSLPAFWNESYFLQAVSSRFPPIDSESFVLFTFHGLPESQIRKQPGCLAVPSCCESPQAALCYRAQCFSTAKALAHLLNLSAESWGVSFQSRLGPTKWIGPYTDDVLKTVASKHSNIIVVSPSFVSDCLETLEELGVEGQDTFFSFGGKRFHLVPCVNDSDLFAEGLSKSINEAISCI